MKRVVITGMGLVNASGLGIEKTWNDVLNQRVRLARFQRWQPYEGCPIQIGSEVLDDLESFLPPKSYRETDRSIHLAAAALGQCIQDSGMDDTLLERSGLIYGTTIGQPGIVEQVGRQLNETDSVDRLTASLINSTAGIGGLVHLTVAFRIRGISYLVQQATASGAAAVGEAFDKIRSGRTSMIFAGAADNSFNRLALTFYNKIKMLPRDYHDRSPEDLVVPFCKPELSDRAGVGEAGAVVLLEDLEHAQRRGAKIYAEVCGTGTYQYNETIRGRDLESRGLVEAIAQLPKDKPVDAAFTTAMGLQFMDCGEYNALGRLFAGDLRVFSPEPYYGHVTSPVGIINMMLAAKMLQTGIFPPNRNIDFRQLDTPDALALPDAPLNSHADRALITVRGFGGYNCAVLLGRA